jgi:hypothetical protein
MTVLVRRGAPRTDVRHRMRTRLRVARTRRKLWWLTPLAIIAALVLLNDQPTALVAATLVLGLVLSASTWPDDVCAEARRLGSRVWPLRRFTGVLVVAAAALAAYRMRAALEQANWTGTGVLFTLGLFAYLIGVTLAVARHLGVTRPRRGRVAVLPVVLLGLLVVIVLLYGWAVVPVAVLVLATVLAAGLFWWLGTHWPWASLFGLAVGIAVPSVLGAEWLLAGERVLVLAAVTVLVTEAIVITHVPDPSPRAVMSGASLSTRSDGPSALLGAIGVALCLLSGVLLSLAAVRLAADRANSYASELALDAGAAGNAPAVDRPEACGRDPAGTGAQHPAPGSDDELVCRFRPILRLAQTAGRTTLLASAVEPVVGPSPQLEPLEGDGGERFARCPRTLDGATSDAVCARVVLPDATPQDLPRVTVGGATYAAVHHRAGARDWPLDGVETIIQYWLFYLDNAWQNPTALGPARQDHRGDWEFVSVALDAGNRPVAVSYSAHCGGTRRPWARVPVLALEAAGQSILVGDGRQSGTHPLVIVAAGSHANYPVVGRRAADWTSCQLNDAGAPWYQRAALEVGKRLTFVGNGLELIPATGILQIPDVRLPDQARPVLQAPWYWGLRETMSLSGIPIADEPHGPDSPAFKRDYAEPWTPFTNTTVWACDVGRDCGALPGAG